MTANPNADVEAVARALIEVEGEGIVRDMAGHVGNEVHAVLKRHGMMMATSAGAIGIGVLAAVNLLNDTLAFALNALDDDPDIAAVIGQLVRSEADDRLGLAITAWNTRATLPAVQAGWRPIESAPKDGTDILLWSHDAAEPAVMIGFWADWNDSGSDWTDTWTIERIDADPLYWQPLPAAPIPPLPAVAAEGEGRPS